MCCGNCDEGEEKVWDDNFLIVMLGIFFCDVIICNFDGIICDDLSVRFDECVGKLKLVNYINVNVN